jgi:hypothetical protein
VYALCSFPCCFDVVAWYEWRVESKIIVSYIW